MRQKNKGFALRLIVLFAANFSILLQKIQHDG